MPILVVFTCWWFITIHHALCELGVNLCKCMRLYRNNCSISFLFFSSTYFFYNACTLYILNHYLWEFSPTTILLWKLCFFFWSFKSLCHTSFHVWLLFYYIIIILRGIKFTSLFGALPFKKMIESEVCCCRVECSVVSYVISLWHNKTNGSQ